MARLLVTLIMMLTGHSCKNRTELPLSSAKENAFESREETTSSETGGQIPYPMDLVKSLHETIWNDYLNLFKTCTPEGQNIAKTEEDLPEDCLIVTLTLPEEPPEPNVHRRRILLVDRGAAYTAMVRYRNRTLGIYKEDENSGTISSFMPVIKVPKLFSDLMNIIQKFEIPLHSMLMESVGTKLLVNNFVRGLMFRNSLAILDIDGFHGSTILSKLMDLIPNAEVVLVDRPQSHGVPKGIFCKINTMDGLTWAQEYLDREYAGIKSIVERYRIDFINLSYGSNPPQLSRAWTNACKDSGTLDPDHLDEFVRILSEHNRKISNLDDIVVFKSSNSASTPGSPDCISEDNFIRVNTVETSGYEPIKKFGSFPSSFSGHPECTDIVLSFDHGSAEAPFRTEFNEFGFGPEHQPQYWASGNSSSFANPIAIAYYITIRDMMEKEYGQIFPPREILKAATLTGKHVTPARYDLLPVCQIYKNICRFQKPFENFISEELSE